MLPRPARLRSSAEFRAATQRGPHSVRVAAPTVVVHLSGASQGSEATPRAGFVVSRSVGGAVVRNRVRRRLRHAARELAPLLPGSSVLVVRALPSAAQASFEALDQDLRTSVQRAVRRLDQRSGSGEG